MELSDVVAEYDPRENGSQVRMRCPFREKHTDGSGQFSMFLTPEINAYHCFSCKSKGKLTSLLTSRFGLSLTQAYDYVDIDSYVSGSRKVKKEALREDPYYRLHTPKMYSKRKLKESVLRKFKVGETDESVIIPYIEDRRIVGYTTRNKKNPSKYSLDFKRGNHLYNYVSGRKSAIVVEGQADVWRLEGWGLYAVALGGTEFSERIVDILKEFDDLYIAMDNDLAGVTAANKLYLALYKDANVSFIEYEGDDPDKADRSSFFNGYKDPRDYYEFKSAFLDVLEFE